jgi:hypothetical protein
MGGINCGAIVVSPPRHSLFKVLKGGKFEMNRSQCPVAKILVYKEVHEFFANRLPLTIRHSNFTL